MTGSNAAPFLDNNLALDLDIKGRHFAAQALRHQVQRDGVTLEMIGIGIEENIENLFGFVTERAQQYGGRQLAPTIDTHKQ